MHMLPTPDGVEADAKAAGLSLAQLCRNAGIAQTTFWRWRAGTTEPTLDVVRRLLRAVDESATSRRIESERVQAEKAGANLR